MSDNARFRKGFLLALVVAITAAFVFVIRDFLMTIFVAAIFSGLAHPLYRRLRKAFGGREALASAVTLLIIVLLVGGPLVFVVSIVTSEAVRMTENVTPFVTAADQRADQHQRLSRSHSRHRVACAVPGDAADEGGRSRRQPRQDRRVLAHEHHARHAGADRRLLHDALRDVLLPDQRPPLPRFDAAVPPAARVGTESDAAALRLGHPRHAQGHAPHRHGARHARRHDLRDPRHLRARCSGGC